MLGAYQSYDATLTLLGSASNSHVKAVKLEQLIEGEVYKISGGVQILSLKTKPVWRNMCWVRRGL